MRSKVVGGVIAGIFILLMLALAPLSVADATDINWERAHILTSEQVDFTTYGAISSCGGGAIETIHNRSDGHDYVACVFGGPGSVRMARYISPQSVYAYALSPAYSHDFYKLIGPCDGTHSCAYSQTMDMLMVPTYLNSWSRGMGIYSNVKQHLKKRFNTTPAYTYYELSFNEPPFQVYINGLPAMAESGAFAQGGPWAVIEVRSYGVLLVNLETFRVRRVRAPGADYGLGHDPAIELAISDDGSSLALTGMRAGLELYKIDELCGDGVEGTIDKNYGRLTTPCANASLDTNTLFPNLYAGHYPSFTPDGSRLRLVTHLKDSTIWRVMVGVTASGVSGLSYLALGDSYSSGQGEDSDERYLPYTNAPPHVCHVGRDAYPFVVAAAWGASVENVACSGAQTIDVAAVGKYDGQGGRLSSYSALDRRYLTEAAIDLFRPGITRQVEFAEKYQPRFITVGIGGNDAGLMDKLNSCLGIDTCEWVQDPAKRTASAVEIANIDNDIRATLVAIKRASPQSKLAVIGYPEIVSDQDVCSGVVGMLLNQAERVFFKRSIHYLNDVLKSVASSEGVVYVDTTTSLYGERLCEGSSRAMNGIRYGDDIAPIKGLSGVKAIGSESFHPTPYGHRLIAGRILGTCENGLRLCNQIEEAPKVAGTTSTWPGYDTSYWGDIAGNSAPRLFRLDSSKLVALTQDSVTLRVPEGVFVAGSEYSAAVSSGGEIARGAVPEAGPYEVTVRLTPRAVDGFSTIHIRGEGVEGPVDAYAVVAGQIHTSLLDVASDSREVTTTRSVEPVELESSQKSTMSRANSTAGVDDGLVSTGALVSRLSSTVLGLQNTPLGRANYAASIKGDIAKGWFIVPAVVVYVGIVGSLGVLALWLWVRHRH